MSQKFASGAAASESSGTRGARDDAAKKKTNQKKGFERQ